VEEWNARHIYKWVVVVGRLWKKSSRCAGELAAAGDRWASLDDEARGAGAAGGSGGVV
jgi:hypothetical protein